MERVKKKRRVRYTAKDKARLALAVVFLILSSLLVLGYVKYDNLFMV